MEILEKVIYVQLSNETVIVFWVIWLELVIYKRCPCEIVKVNQNECWLCDAKYQNLKSDN